MATATGKVVQVLGNVVDVEFTPETLPKINDALSVRVNDDRACDRATARIRRKRISAAPRCKRAT